jgi:DNA mismatch repair protein MutL
MSKIHILSEHVSNRIAAGEVIERPASVVKELVENAIDAGATRIVIEIERAGSRLIGVADNGSGMDADDALLSLEPHGTSKIAVEADIDRIVTLGFRGEALPSIAAISRFTLRTRTAAMVEGTQIRVEGGQIRETSPVGCAPGTSIQVRDLFFNTPARRKFLKSAPTEEQHIENMVLMLALPYPEIAFELIIDGRAAVISPAAPDLGPRIAAFFGKNFSGQMLAVDHRDGEIAVGGFVAAPGFTRNSRREQRTFVNRRAVESPAIYRGLRDGYATLSESGRFPPCVLFLAMPPEEVDVNVHPAKREVRFKQEYAVSRAVAAAVGHALRRRERPHSSLDRPFPVKSLLESVEISYAPADVEQPDMLVWEPDAPRAAEAEDPAMPGMAILPEPARSPDGAAPEYAAEPAPLSCDNAAPPEPAAPLPRAMVFDGDWPTEVIGVLDRTYILAAGRGGLILIDQHAAHERVLFERLLANAKTGAASQHLLLPVTLELPRQTAGLMWRGRDLFLNLGFDLEPVGPTTVLVNAVPSSLPETDLERMLLDTLDELQDNAQSRIPLEAEFVARAACKAAIKAHDQLTLQTARLLVEELGKCRQGTLCPHGRPTMLTITLAEIERRFGRK